MSRQANPIIIRLGLKNNFWKLKYFSKKPEQNSFYVYQNVQLKTYLGEFLIRSGLYLHSLSITKQENKLKLFLSYYLTGNLNKLLNFDQKTPTLKFESKEINRIVKCKKSKLFTKFNTWQEIKRQSFFGEILKSLSIVKNSKTNIFIRLKQLNKKPESNLTKLEKLDIQQKIFLLRRFQKNQFFNGLLNSIIVTTNHSNSTEFFANNLAQELLTLKKQTIFLYFLKQSLNLFVNSKFSKISGLKLRLKGKLNKNSRAHLNQISFGTVPTQVLVNKLSYSQKACFLKSGTVGLKIWVNEKF